MSLNYQNSDPIVLGSGELYIMNASEIINPASLTPEEEAKLVNIGAIDSGASVTIAKEYIEIKSSNRGTIIKLPKDTAVTFKTGIITFILKNIANFLYGSEYIEDLISGTKKMVIGKDDRSPVVYLRFVHTDKTTGKQLIVNIYRAQFGAEQEFNFNDETALSVNYEFQALTTPVTDDGGKIKYNYIEFLEVDPSIIPEEPEV